MIFGSKTRFPYRVRIHDKECGAVARALHHKTKIHSLSAVLENVSGTTFERKLMSIKTSFKRIALALVVALGFGVLSVSPSTAVADEVLTVGTPSATTVELGESVTVSIDLSFISESAGESRTVAMTQTGTGFTATTLIPLATDSANVANHSNALTPSNATNYGYSEVVATAGDSIVATAGITYTRAKWTLRLSNAATAGTYTYVVSSRNGAGSAAATNTGTIGKSATFTITVTAANTTGSAAKTLMYLNQSVGAANAPVRNNGLGYLAADSSLTVSAGTAATPIAVGYMFVEPRNSSDTRTSTSQTAVTASVVLTVSGPGLLGLIRTAVGTAAATKAKSVTLDSTSGDTVTVYSDGTAGTMTITSSIGGVNLTQAAKTVTFVGFADTFTPTVETKTVLRGSTAAGVITFVAKDSAGNAINGTDTQYRTGHPSGFFVVVADTKVVGGTTMTSADRGAGSTAVYSACSYVTVRAKWVCDLPITDSGVATTIYIADSYTATSATKKSEALTLTVVGTGAIGTISLGGTSFNSGTKATFTITSKDGDGRNVVDGASTPFSGLRWESLAPTFGAATGSDDDGGALSSGNLEGYLSSASASTFVNGVDTVVVYMPTQAGTYVLKGVTGVSTPNPEQTLLTFTVVNPTDVLVNAATAAAEAAGDAAAEAIDAANAATDAANLAAEAADAATVAAEEARDAADAATAAVEELATAVATLMAALKAQVTTLANTVAKIAKKVGVKK